MATTDAVVFPPKSQAFRFTEVIKSSSTGNPLTGGLATLVCEISQDGAAFTTAGVTIAEIDTNTGWVTVDLNSGAMAFSQIAYRITAANANAVYATGIISTVDLSEPTGHWLLATVKKLEHGILQGTSYLLNKVKRNVATGTITLYKLDETTAVGTMAADTTPVANEVTKGELT